MNLHLKECMDWNS